MKKVFETKDKVEAECLAEKLEDECLETKLEQNAGKYELYVGENVYDEALLQIENLEYDLPKMVSQNKAKSNKFQDEDEYEKSSFLYAVEKFFQLKYKHLLLISVVFAFVFVLPFGLPMVISSIKKMDSDNIKITALLFAVAFVISQAILISNRYYQDIKELRNFFSIKLGTWKDPDYSRIGYKIIHFVLAILLHLIYYIFTISVMIR